MKSNKISPVDVYVVVPGYNESAHLAKVLTQIKKITPNIIFVDDGSSDNSAQLASKIITHVISHPINLGKGAALQTGCDYAFDRLGAKAVIFLDADGQHDPTEIPNFFKALQSKADLIFGVRQLNNRMPILRRMANFGSSLLILLIFGKYFPDIPSGYKAMTRRGYQQLRWQATDYSVELEIAINTAKRKIMYRSLIIKTIYHSLDRGMTALDLVQLVKTVIVQRFTK